MKFKIIAILSLVFVFSACTYYEHGPVFSFKPAKSRIAGEWQLCDVRINDNTEQLILENESDIIYEFSEEGSVIVKSNNDSRSSSNVISGSWEFNEDKTSLIISVDNNDSDDIFIIEEMTILRLTDEELWISDQNSSTRNPEYITERRYTKILK